MLCILPYACSLLSHLLLISLASSLLPLLILPLKWFFKRTDNNSSQSKLPAPTKPEAGEAVLLGSAEMAEAWTINNHFFGVHIPFAFSWNAVICMCPFQEKFKFPLVLFTLLTDLVKSGKDTEMLWEFSFNLNTTGVYYFTWLSLFEKSHRLRPVSLASLWLLIFVIDSKLTVNPFFRKGQENSHGPLPLPSSPAVSFTSGFMAHKTQGRDWTTDRPIYIRNPKNNKHLHLSSGLNQYLKLEACSCCTRQNEGLTFS